MVSTLQSRTHLDVYGNDTENLTNYAAARASAYSNNSKVIAQATAPALSSMMTSLPFWSMLQQSKMIQKWVPNAVEKTALIAGAVFIGAIVAVAILYQ